MTPETHTIYLATDHAGFSHKEALKRSLVEAGYQVVDCGAEVYDETDDYSDYIGVAARSVAEEPMRRAAIIFGASGQGEGMMANRSKGVRAAVYYGGPEEIITRSREHNDANVLSIGAAFIDEATMLRVVMLWLQTPFSHEARHERRIEELELL